MDVIRVSDFIHSTHVILFIFSLLFRSRRKDAKPLPRFNKHSVFWIVASVAVTYYVDFLRTILENDDIKSWWFNAGLVLLGICLSLAAFCMCTLSGSEASSTTTRSIPHPSHHHRGLHFCVIFNIALWPVWSFCTPLILFTQFMGVVMFISLLG
uniref:Transmembrane protein 128 n=1 Tax=Salarias fasciatus TaxID=181472 RepID=A0A672GDG7_SALFA